VKIRVLSDLHLECCDWLPPAAQADVVVLAGDIHNGTAGLRWASRSFGAAAVIYVPGNHEFYGGELTGVLHAMRNEARQCGIHLLDGDEVILSGVRFLGATLWTDFSLYGSAPEQIGRAMADAEYGMSDYQAIRSSAGSLRARESRDIHIAQAGWLEHRLKRGFDGPTVVISHFLPHRISIHPKYQGAWSNPFFASDLDRLVRPPVSLWIHGHTHESVDAVVNGTRVVCNPRGQVPEEPNQAFDPCFVVEVQEREPAAPQLAASRP
jgi:predicted phosphodiesterase/uncharacterized protein YoaH (UPF0181 family)